MGKGIRITLILVALLCVPALIFPELGIGNSPASPAALLIICGLAAILWPSSKPKPKRGRD